MNTRTYTRIIKVIASATAIAAIVTPLATASPKSGKRIQVPPRLASIQEPGSTGYVPFTITYQEPGSTGYVPFTMTYREP